MKKQILPRTTALLISEFIIDYSASLGEFGSEVRGEGHCEGRHINSHLSRCGPRSGGR